MINCRTLGPFEAYSETGESVDIPGNKNRALLVYLARSPRRSRGREQLMGLLWADKSEEKARHSLREALRVLRQRLGDESLESREDQIKLVGEAVRLDVEDFESLEAEGDWDGAANLVAGEFMEGLSIKGEWAFEEWLTAERTFWRNRSTNALSRWSEKLLATGRTREALQAAMRGLRIDAASGTATKAAMKSLALDGDRTDALALYDVYLERLAELGAQPDIETQKLADKVRSERIWQLPPTVATSNTKGAESRRAPLIGRGEELAALDGAWAACRTERRARAVLIEGDNGSGKTRLAEEITARARLSGAAVATFRSVAGDVGLPGTGLLGLVRGGLQGGAGLATASPNALGAFAAQIPEMADRFGLPKGDTPPLEAAIVDMMRAVTAEQPTIVLVDDAQLCDRESLLALIALLRDLASSPALIVFSHAPHPAREELDDLRSRIGRDVPGVTICLDPLSTSELRELAEWALPEYADEEIERLTRRLAVDSAGMPLLAVELLHAVAIGMDLDATKGAWPRPFSTLSQTLPADLPDTIVGAIRVGFRRLSKEAQRLLSAAAVLYEPVAAEKLSRGTGIAGEELSQALDELEWQRWLACDARGYSFVARIVCEVVARDMLTNGETRRIKTRLDSR